MTVPSQALFLLNNEFVIRERDRLLRFVGEYRRTIEESVPRDSEMDVWSAFGQALMASAEFQTRSGCGYLAFAGRISGYADWSQ